jgi:xanthine dehydrogenase accessory factor
MLDILEMMNQWIEGNRNIALATVVKTWGSAPRGEGSKLGITSDMAMIGSVSGGCVEGAVVEEGVAGLKDGKPRLLKFGVADDTAWEVGLTCGGSIEVYVEPLDLTWWELTSKLAQADEYSVTVTMLEGESIGEKVLFDAQSNVLYQTTNVSDALLASMTEIARSAKKSGMTMLDETRVMVDIQASRPHLILIGGVHVSIPLQQMAQMVGFRVSIIDPRSAFASEERFPDVANILHSYPDKALPELGLDRNTYLAVLTHDPKIDDKALTTALPANLPYIGVLSSSRTHAKRVARLKELGIADELIEQIRTPVGIDIGSSTPEEIALCILAEIVAVRNGVL